MKVVCDECGESIIFDPHQYHCECGGAWEVVEDAIFNKTKIDASAPGIWRYKDCFSLDKFDDPIRLGAGWTPLVHAVFNQKKTYFKLEYISPTGSFKDRGIELEINHLFSSGVKEVVEDSSGNAGASLAAYAGCTGMKASIFAPENASTAKLAQIEIFGAELHKIKGSRSETTEAALHAVSEGAVYASHAYNPVYLLGQQSFAWEIWEQFNGDIPDAIVIPVGQGGLFLGAWFGFRRLLMSGYIKELPCLFAVQPELLSPIKEALTKGLMDIPEIKPKGASLAEGLAISKPVRGKRILQALRETHGDALTVTEDEIESAWRALAHRGLFAEPTSAAAAAALPQILKHVGADATVLVALTGSGLKSPVKG